MKKFFNLLCLIILIAFSANGQERYADITVAIIEPIEGHTFVSPGTDSVKVHVINLGPDTVYIGDKYSVQVRFGGGIFLPVYGKIQKRINPGEYFIQTQKLTIDFVPSVEGFPFCVEAKVFNVQSGFLLNYGDEPDQSNNRVCISANHIDTRENVGIFESQSTSNITISPNPTQSVIKVRGQNQLEKVQVISISGQVLTNWENDEITNEVELNLSHLEAGMYFVHVGTIDGIWRKRIMVQ